MPSSKKVTKSTKSKKGGAVELSPLAAAGIFYAAAHYGKKANRRMKGGEDVVTTTPGGATPVISTGKPEMPTAVVPAVSGEAKPANSYIPTDVKAVNPSVLSESEARSALVTGGLDLKGNPYLGATRASRAAPIDTPSSLLQQGGARKRKPTKRGGFEATMGSAVQSPLVSSKLDLEGNPYLGGTKGSRAAPVDAPGTLLGGAKKSKSKSTGKGRKQKGGECGSPHMSQELMPVSTSPATPLPPVPSMGSSTCGHMAASIPPGTSLGGKLGVSQVVPGAIGGVKGQEEPAMFGGKYKKKSSKSKSKKRGGDFESSIGGVKDQEEPLTLEPSTSPASPASSPSMEGGSKKKKSKSKKHGGNEEGIEDGIDGGDTAEDMIGAYQGGGIKKGRKDRKGQGKKRGGADEEQLERVEEMDNTYEGGGKKNRRKGKGNGKKRGGAEGGEVEAFNAGDAAKQADALGGFDSLLSDLKKQVGGKYKKKGGAFKLYARELSSLSKKLQKLL